MSNSEVTTISTTPFTGTSAPVGAQEYTVPISAANEEGQSVLIHIVNPSDAPITVTLTFQGNDKEITVAPGDTHSEFIARPSNFPSGLPTETARLKSDSPFVASVTMVGSCSSYLAIPTEGLGKRYQVITWDPATSPMGNAWFTISTIKSTVVKIAIPEGTCVVKSSYINPLCGDEFQVYLPEYAAITFSSVDDLSGTTIEAQEPVLVIAGNDDINIGSTSVNDNSISELFPVEAWGTDFVVPPVPENDGSGYSIKMSCGSSSATAIVQSASGTTTHELTEGKSVVVDFTDNSILSISSNSPIQVFQFVRGGQSSSDTGCPSSLNVIATSLYMNTYYTDVWLSKAAYVDYVSMIIEGSEVENLKVDDEAVDSADWKDVPGTTMKCKHMKVTNQRTKFAHTSEKFGLFRYSYLKATDIDKACALSYVAGADFSYAKSMNASTTPSASNESSTGMPSTTAASMGSTMTMGSTTTAAPSMLQITDCSCLNLTSTVQPASSGAYYLEGQQYKDKPVYKRKDCEMYLYYYEDSSVGYWLVGPVKGSNKAYIANPRIYRPINDTQPGSWTVYDTDKDDFVPDPGFQIMCSCSFETSCTSGEFVQNGTNLLEGVFSLTDKFYNGKPVYEHESGKLFLYYNRDTTGTCSYWVVSNKLGSTAGIIYAYDTSAQSPGDVITWQSKGQATSTDKISFTCYMSSEEDS